MVFAKIFFTHLCDFLKWMIFNFLRCRVWRGVVVVVVVVVLHRFKGFFSISRMLSRTDYLVHTALWECAALREGGRERERERERMRKRERERERKRERDMIEIKEREREEERIVERKKERKKTKQQTVRIP